MKKKFICLLLSAVMLLTMVFAGAEAAYADSGAGIYVRQEGSGKCTLASAVMLLRSKSVMEDNPDWVNITQSSLMGTAWITGTGLRHSFTYCGMSVSYAELEDANKKQQMIDLLEMYPEGIVIYVRSLPHAVLLTRYDEAEDTFYCADPGLAAYEMTLEESWLARIFSGAVQDDIISAVNAYWYISSYRYMAIPVYSTEPEPADPADSSSEAGESGDASVPSDNGTEDVCFDRVKTYSSDLFEDIVPTEWYVEYIAAVYEMGLMNGSDEKTFDVDGNVTIGQAITMAARIYSQYTGDGYKFEARTGNDWYLPYVDYAYDRGIISSKYYYADFNAQAYRIQFVEIMGGALPDKALAEINYYADGSIGDVDESAANGQAVYRLYRAGVLTGEPDSGFNPYGKITRAQAAAIISRMADSSLRVMM